MSMYLLKGWYYNYAGALSTLARTHGDSASDILELGLKNKTINLGIPPADKYGFCWSMDGVTWLSEINHKEADEDGAY